MLSKNNEITYVLQLFYSFFKSLVGKDVVVELKNDLRYENNHSKSYSKQTLMIKFDLVFSICGTLHSVDQYLNIKLTDISVNDTEKYPHMLYVLKTFKRRRCWLAVFFLIFIFFFIKGQWRTALFVVRSCVTFNYLVKKLTHSYYKMRPEKKPWPQHDKRPTNEDERRRMGVAS